MAKGDDSWIRSNALTSIITTWLCRGAAFENERSFPCWSQGRAAGKRPAGSCREAVDSFESAVGVHPNLDEVTEPLAPVALVLEGVVSVERNGVEVDESSLHCKPPAPTTIVAFRPRRVDERLGEARARVVRRCGAQIRARNFIAAAHPT